MASNSDVIRLAHPLERIEQLLFYNLLADFQDIVGEAAGKKIPDEIADTTPLLQTPEGPMSMTVQPSKEVISHFMLPTYIKNIETRYQKIMDAIDEMPDEELDHTNLTRELDLVTYRSELEDASLELQREVELTQALRKRLGVVRKELVTDYLGQSGPDHAI
eukprot:gnl/Dysnectes_brevis/5429_a7799_734.p1 GENE.gnl/Dysnectes_brevis/5429_a7799_734~~gnl/Dysnectes_brevis/5429_a7799_734.p1  ORF type:complete len:162 (+),score=24.92 gnl/Dysnectes_brevis/5429_a7799_734:61-546(+)